MGRKAIDLGPDVAKAGLMKTTGNFITAALMEVVAEAHVLAEMTGLGCEALEELVEANYGPLMLSMSKRMTTGVYVPRRGEMPWSELGLAVKDVGHGVKCAGDVGVRLEIGEVVLGHLREADRYAVEEKRKLDSSSLYGVVRRDAGLDFETELVKERDA